MRAEPSTRRPPVDGATLAVLFVALLTLTPAKYVLAGVPIAISPANLVALGLGLCWLCCQLGNVSRIAKGRNAVRTALFGFVVALLAIYGVGTWQYLPPDELKLADHAMVLVLAVVGVALLVLDGVRNVQRLDTLLKFAVSAFTVVAGIGVLHFTLGVDLTTHLELPIFREDLGAANSSLDRGSFERVHSTAAHPIEFGVVCAMALPLALHYAFMPHRNAVAASCWWLCSIVIGLGLLFSISRSAILGVAVAGAILLIGWSPARRRVVLMVAPAVLVVVYLLVPGLLGTILGLFTNVAVDGSVDYRTHDYAIAAQQVAQHLWFGHGNGTWYTPKHLTFDNQYLLTLVEGGLVGLAALLALYGTALHAAARVYRRTTDPAIRDLSLALLAGLAIAVVVSATFDLQSFGMVTGLTFLLLGATGALHRLASVERNPAVPLARAGGSS